jgi:putative DNA primase/helicase
LEVFANRFALDATVGTLLNISGEAHKLSPAIEGIIKQIVGQEPITIDRKNKSQLNFLPTVRLMITTNKRPSFVDTSDGIWRRLLILPFKVQVPEEKRILNLGHKLFASEASGIFNWALTGYHRLHANGRFTIPDIMVETIQEFRNEDSPLREFLQDTLAPSSGGRVEKSSIYRCYVRWAERSKEKVMTEGEFGKAMKGIFPRVRTVRNAPSEGNRRRSWEGLEWIGRENCPDEGEMKVEVGDLG